MSNTMPKNIFLLNDFQRLRSLLGLAIGIVGVTNMVAAIVPRPHWDLFLGAKGRSRQLYKAGPFPDPQKVPDSHGVSTVGRSLPEN